VIIAVPIEEPALRPGDRGTPGVGACVRRHAGFYGLSEPEGARAGRGIPPSDADKYRHVVTLGIQSTLVYRVNFLVRALFGLVPLLALILLWRAIFEGRADANRRGLRNSPEVVTYYLVVNVVVALTSVTEDDWQIAADIRDGRRSASSC
jgi:hypothetical protein